MKLIIWDFSKTLLFPKDRNYQDSLNKLYRDIQAPFDTLFDLNDELISFIISLDIDSIIFTTGIVQNDPSIIGTLNTVFKSIENIESIGYPKENPEAYMQLCNKYNVTPEETLFIDDSETNLIAAAKAGLKTYQYKNNDDVIDFIKEL